jgi:hypothetical protein
MEKRPVTSLPADCLDDLRDPRLKRLDGYWRDRCGAVMPPVTIEHLMVAVTLCDIEPEPGKMVLQ